MTRGERGSGCGFLPPRPARRRLALANRPARQSRGVASPAGSHALASEPPRLRVCARV